MGAKGSVKKLLTIMVTGMMVLGVSTAGAEPAPQPPECDDFTQIQSIEDLEDWASSCEKSLRDWFVQATGSDTCTSIVPIVCDAVNRLLEALSYCGDTIAEMLLESFNEQGPEECLDEMVLAIEEIAGYADTDELDKLREELWAQVGGR